MEHNRNDGHNTNLQILTQPNIGLDSDVRHSVVQILNNTLANEAVLAQKTRNAHWNVSGASFFELHTLFDVQYKQLNDISDEISKHARMLGGLPIGSFEEFLKYSRLDEQPGDVPNIMNLLADHEAAICFLREDAKKCSEEYEDEVTHDFLVGILYLHKKMVLMLHSHIDHDHTDEENKGSKIFPPQC